MCLLTSEALHTGSNSGVIKEANALREVIPFWQCSREILHHLVKGQVMHAPLDLALQQHISKLPRGQARVVKDWLTLCQHDASQEKTFPGVPEAGLLWLYHIRTPVSAGSM
jgi:hypothetical protein